MSNLKTYALEACWLFSRSNNPEAAVFVKLYTEKSIDILRPFFLL